MMLFDNAAIPSPMCAFGLLVGVQLQFEFEFEFEFEFVNSRHFDVELQDQEITNDTLYQIPKK